MSVLSDRSVFAAMKQDGPFAVGEKVSLNRPFSQAHRRWVKHLLADQVQTTKYRAVRSQIFNLLQIHAYSGLQQLLDDADLRHAVSDKANLLLGRLFNLDVESHKVHTCLLYTSPSPRDLN